MLDETTEVMNLRLNYLTGFAVVTEGGGITTQNIYC